MQIRIFQNSSNLVAPARVVFFATAAEQADKPSPVEQKAENADQMIEQLKAELGKSTTTLDAKRAEILQIFQKFQTENQNSKLKNEAGTFMLKVALKLQNIDGKANYGAYKKMNAADKVKIEGTMQNIRQILEGKNSQGEDQKDGVTTSAKIEADRQKVLADYGEAKPEAAQQNAVQPQAIEEKSVAKENASSVTDSSGQVAEKLATQDSNPPLVAEDAAQQIEAEAEKTSMSAPDNSESLQAETPPVVKQAIVKNDQDQSVTPQSATVSAEPEQKEIVSVSQKEDSAKESGVSKAVELQNEIQQGVAKLSSNPELKTLKLSDGSILAKGVETNVEESDRGQAEDDAYAEAEDEALLELQGKTSNESEETVEGTTTTIHQHAEGHLQGVQRFTAKFENGTLSVIIRVPVQTAEKTIEPNKQESETNSLKNLSTSDDLLGPDQTFTSEEIAKLRDLEAERNKSARELVESDDPKFQIVELSDGSFLAKGACPYQDHSNERKNYKYSEIAVKKARRRAENAARDYLDPAMTDKMVRNFQESTTIPEIPMQRKTKIKLKGVTEFRPVFRDSMVIMIIHVPANGSQPATHVVDKPQNSNSNLEIKADW